MEMLVDTQKGAVDKTSLIRCQLLSVTWLVGLCSHTVLAPVFKSL